MQLRSTRRLAVIAGVMVCALGAPAIAAAAPANPSDPGLPSSRAAAEKAVRSEQIAAYTKRFRVSDDAARRSLALQTQGGDIAPKLEKRLGGALAQVHFDNRAGEFVVLADKGRDRLASSVEAVMAESGVEDAYRLETNAFGRVELEATLASLNATLVDFERENRTSVDERAGTLRVTVRDPAIQREVARQAREIAEQRGVPVEVVAGKPNSAGPTIACTFPSCDGLAGGVSWGYSPTNHHCTYGFTAIRWGWAPYMLTAGHCTIYSPGTNVYHRQPSGVPLPAFGTTSPGLVNFGAGGDSGLADLVSTWPRGGGFMRWMTGTYSQVSGSFTSTIPIGYSVCRHGGRNYGFHQADQCGWVTTHNNTVNYTNAAGSPIATVPGLLGVDSGLCVKEGDSGSPVTWTNADWAAGLVSGGTRDGVNATEPYNSYCPSTSFVEPIHRALAAYGATLYSTPAW